jgi:hypothetical protein
MFDDITAPTSSTSLSYQPFQAFEHHFVQMLGHNLRVALAELYNDATRGSAETHNRNKALRHRLSTIPRWRSDLIDRETRLIQSAIPNFDTMLSALVVDKTRTFADGVFEVYGPQNILDSCTIGVPPISSSKFIHSVFSMLSMRLLNDPLILERDYDKSSEIIQSAIRQVVNQYVPYDRCAQCMLKSQRTEASPDGGIMLSRWKNVVGEASDVGSFSTSPFKQVTTDNVIDENSETANEVVQMNDMPNVRDNGFSFQPAPGSLPVNNVELNMGAAELPPSTGTASGIAAGTAAGASTPDQAALGQVPAQVLNSTAAPFVPAPFVPAPLVQSGSLVPQQMQNYQQAKGVTSKRVYSASEPAKTVRTARPVKNK